jgi:hypothetical protein
VHESVAIRLSTHEPLFTVGRTRRLQQRQGQAVLRITEESFLGFVSRSFILKGATLKPSCWTASRTTCLRLYLRRRRSPGSSSSSLFFLSTFRDRSVSCRVPTLGSAVERLRSMSRNNKLIGVVLAQPVRVSKFVLCARRCLLSFLPSTDSSPILSSPQWTPDTSGGTLRPSTARSTTRRGRFRVRFPSLALLRFLRLIVLFFRRPLHRCYLPRIGEPDHPHRYRKLRGSRLLNFRFVVFSPLSPLTTDASI